jgi:NADH dehydrogenase
MRVLVTGGTGVVGTAAVRALLARGHEVRLFSRNAERDAQGFPEGVEGRRGSIGDPNSVRGSMLGMDAVLHVAGIVAEDPPEVTFERINVEGTRLLVEEAQRSAVKRFAYVSSLGAERGSSDYHRSKKAAEDIVRAFAGDWIILRPGNVYGPGDEVISLLLKMVRTLPAVPVIDDGDQPFQPVWADDLGEAIAVALERGDLAGRTLLLAGDEVTTTNEILDELARLTGKTPPRLPVPKWLASAGAQVASKLGMDTPVNTDQLTMLGEGIVIPPGEPNALTEVLHVRATRLREGLGQLVDAQPEQLPAEGVGDLVRRRYWADIHGSALDADALWDRFVARFGELAPEGTVKVDAEPGTPTWIEEGSTLTLGLPVRGNVQVRVAEAGERSATFVTLAGHPLSGTIRFRAIPRPARVVRFEVTTYDRASNLVDYLALATVGRILKRGTWRKLVENVVEESGGEAPEGVRTESTPLEGEDAERAEEWAERLVMRRRREEMEAELEVREERGRDGAESGRAGAARPVRGGADPGEANA